ncbi:polysaccharide deacetylase family protein [Embleya scabrispora]|uniref:polysaccharide deacetylase family protein n=1 Tax=Embleya scabrispora TaxID=159449 RepID=UPI0004768327|nr:polysaccharide deacetylase family protein [Embleya scabrispora]MYS79257.1 polysaccharide deacetylase family protein [Streptomyces sp. SID5474]
MTAAALVSCGGSSPSPADPTVGATQPAARPVPTAAGVDPSISRDSEDGGKTVNLTLDDGPDPVWTPRFLDLLAKHHAKAVFCVLGPNAKAHPDLLGRIVDAGHRLCDHTVHHDTAMDKKPADYQAREILDAKDMIDQASGGRPIQYYRAPGGAFTPESRQIAAAHGMRPLGWNVDPSDYQRPGVDTIVTRVQQQLAKGPTVLLHDGGGNREQTFQALEKLLTWFDAQGYHYSFPKA